MPQTVYSGDGGGVTAVKGMNLTIPRGVRPGVARIRAAYINDTETGPGTLTIENNGVQVQFLDCFPDLRTLRMEKQKTHLGESRTGQAVSTECPSD